MFITETLAAQVTILSTIVWYIILLTYFLMFLSHVTVFSCLMHVFVSLGLFLCFLTWLRFLRETNYLNLSIPFISSNSKFYVPIRNCTFISFKVYGMFPIFFYKVIHKQQTSHEISAQGGITRICALCGCFALLDQVVKREFPLSWYQSYYRCHRHKQMENVQETLSLYYVNEQVYSLQACPLCCLAFCT